MCCHESHNVIDLTKGIVFAAVRYGRCFQVTLGTKKTVLVPCNKQEFTILSSCLRDAHPACDLAPWETPRGMEGSLVTQLLRVIAPMSCREARAFRNARKWLQGFVENPDLSLEELLMFFRAHTWANDTYRNHLEKSEYDLKFVHYFDQVIAGLKAEDPDIIQEAREWLWCFANDVPNTQVKEFLRDALLFSALVPIRRSQP